MLKQQDIEERIRRFPALCRVAGLKVTHQRTAIFGMLAATEGHPTPETVYSVIRRRLPSISLATVYKVLDQFHRHGFLHKVSTENQVARYDANLAPHHHLICEGCGKIQDVDPAPAAGDLPAPGVGDFRVVHCEVIFHGLCASCQGASPADGA